MYLSYTYDLIMWYLQIATSVSQCRGSIVQSYQYRQPFHQQEDTITIVRS